MVPSFLRSRKIHPELVEFTADLLRDSLKTLIWTIGGIFLLWFFVVGLRRPELLFWQFWVVFAIFLASLRLAEWLLQRKLAAAGPAWLAGLALTNLLMILLFRFPEQVIFFALIPLIAIVTLDWQAGLASQAAMLLILWGLHFSRLSSLLEPYYPVTIVGSLVCCILGWVNRQTLLETINRSAHYYRMAQQNLEEARQHRAQLVLALKNLDLAYYRLERANAALVSAWKQAEEAERFKSEFVTYVSHEMRTPLNLISGFSETLLTSPESYGGAPLAGAYREDIHKIWRSAQHLLKLVDDVIDLAKVNVGRISLVREMTDLNGLVLESAGMVRDYIQARGLQIKLQLEQNLPALWIDRLRIQQVLLNLLVNAVRFTEKGWIRVETIGRGGEVMVKVSDSGMGIAEEDLPRVFEEFHSSSRLGEAWHGGGGLGLPISKKLVELHQGQMGVESQPGRGSTFWFTLPRETRQEKPAVPSRPYTTEHFRPKAAGRAIVLVHHDRHIAPLVQRYLEGTRVFPARDLIEAARIAGEIQAVALLASTNSAWEGVPGDWIRVSCPLPDWRKSFPWPGIRDILRKPVSAEDLWSAIGQLDRPVERPLVVDDDPEMVDLLKRMLATQIPYNRLLEAYDGQEALRKIEKYRPDLVLLDLVLPEIDGPEILARMAAAPGLAGIPVILVSGNVEDYAAQALAGSIEITRNGGFQFGEIIRALEPVLEALTPGWDLPGPISPAPPAAPGG